MASEVEWIISWQKFARDKNLRDISATADLTRPKFILKEISQNIFKEQIWKASLL